MVTVDSLLSAIYLEFDRNLEFREHVARATDLLRCQGLQLPPDRDALSCFIEDGRFLGKALLDEYLDLCTTPQWLMAKRCAEAR
jgi:hypothetical protein